ncbi:hypothetical protein [Scytonema sp. UIC 10036]|uniref:hypothetical protein n=1 Tax=Scytonema sp. UIC 10036 TaxID=2304196 RepID=UPI001FAA26E1|nr:hypothetical protein [Scytonema sp. UIC 10036]
MDRYIFNRVRDQGCWGMCKSIPKNVLLCLGRKPREKAQRTQDCGDRSEYLSVEEMNSFVWEIRVTG